MEPTSETLSRAQYSTIAALPVAAAEAYGARPAVRFKRHGEWQDVSFQEVVDAANEIARGLIELGIQAGDRVCVLCNTRPEWTYVDFGISATGAVTVPIYPTNSPEECEWVAGNSEAKAVICENEGQVAKIRAVRGNLPALETVIAVEQTAGSDTISLGELRERGGHRDSSEVERRIGEVSAEDPFTFVYTSGTTGPPKGCVLSHGNWRAACEMIRTQAVLEPGDSLYLYLPLAHVFARLVQLCAFDLGCTLIYFGGDTRQIIPELAEAKTTYFPSVPRIFEKIYTMATADVEQASPEDRERFRETVKLGVKVRRARHRGEPVPEKLERAFEKADEKVFKKVRAIFGGKLREASTGAAPIAPEILEFFYAAGVPVLEGFGMTETTGVATVSTVENFKIGTVGRPLPGVEIRIAEDGEILIKGPNVFQGYFKNDDATRETFADGWLLTGDVGTLDDEGYLKITGRKKDIIITAGGKNLTPANLENELKQSRWISQAVMYGDRRPYPVALITLDEEEISQFAREHDLPADIPSLAQEPSVRELIQSELDRVNAHYAQVEQVKKFTILDHDLSQESGELTPTMKVKRNVVNEKYAPLFDELYSGS